MIGYLYSECMCIATIIIIVVHVEVDKLHKETAAEGERVSARCVVVVAGTSAAAVSCA